ncbi:nitrate- and nitrite sensing domain-containing protein [Actinomadura sp. 9N407]|uniref:sensor histidine kinase n=1 Tax=Actinomadura sp. 9N407 TaxID=3375154 RepID=UPI0037BC9B59
MLLVPLLSLTALWAYAANLTMDRSLEHHRAGESGDRMRDAVQGAVLALGSERRATAAFLRGPESSPRQEVDAARARTDAAAGTFRNRAQDELDATGIPGLPDLPGVLGGADDPVQIRKLDQVLKELERLPIVRATVDSRGMDQLAAITAYSVPVDAMYAYAERLVPSDDPALHHSDLALIAGARAMDVVGREGALIAGASAGDGRLTGAEHRAFVELVGVQRRLWDQQRAGMDPGVHDRAIRPLLQSSGFAELRTLEEDAAGDEPGEARVDAVRWDATVQPVLSSLNSAHVSGARMLGEEQDAHGRGLLLRLGLAGGLGMLAVLFSLGTSLRYGRGLVHEVVALRTSARDLADRRLPRVLARLADGEPIDADAEATRPPASGTTEIQEVAEAFGVVQRSAIEASAGRADLRSGVRRIFLNVARRNQSLLHRQLDMLGELADGASPAERDRLARVDLLTTRMRRHAESLIVLSGAAGGRGARHPVPVVDVLHGAVTEIEDQTRVEVQTLAGERLSGAVATDVIHLVAELLENAAAYSPPHTAVRVMAGRVGTGFVIEVEDRGLGVAPAELAALNELLAGPPPPDLVDTDRLGLLVVARLAARHGIAVSLRPSPYGGTTAIVLLPPEMLDEPALEAPAPDEPEAPDVPEERVPEEAEETGEPGRDEAVPVGGTMPKNDQHAPESGIPAANVVPAGNPWFDDVITPATGSGAGGDAVERSGPAGTYDGLPRRRRRAGLAPRLRQQQGRNGTPSAPAVRQRQGGIVVRSPEEARSMMASIQQGWRRGRAPDQGDGEGR